MLDVKLAPMVLLGGSYINLISMLSNKFTHKITLLHLQLIIFRLNPKIEKYKKVV